MQEKQFNKEAVLVTGSGSGIGQGIAKRFVELGADVLLVDIQEENLLRTKEQLEQLAEDDQKIVAVVGDLCEATVRESVVQAALTEFGKIDILVNSAGIYPSTPFMEITEQEWDLVLDLNLKATFFLNQLVAKSMVENKIKGRIVNITSTASEVARPGVAHYCASKAGAKMMTQVLALELAPFGIRINALGPGLVETETLMKTLTTDKAKKEHQEKVSFSPLQRAALVEEIADGVVYFASSQSTYVTGQTLLIDGGYSAGRVFKSLK